MKPSKLVLSPIEKALARPGVVRLKAPHVVRGEYLHAYWDDRMNGHDPDAETVRIEVASVA